MFSAVARGQSRERQAKAHIVLVTRVNILDIAQINGAGGGHFRNRQRRELRIAEFGDLGIARLVRMSLEAGE